VLTALTHPLHNPPPPPAITNRYVANVWVTVHKARGVLRATLGGGQTVWTSEALDATTEGQTDITARFTLGGCAHLSAALSRR
jgi:hypothetical protein